MNVLFDTTNKKDLIGDEFRKLYNNKYSSKNISIVSPYISDGIQDIDMSILSSFQNARIICNIDNPACNPYLIQKINSKKWAETRTRMDVHAKVYIFDNHTIISSANFTPNGLGKGSIEAGVLLQNEEAGFSIDWFNKLWTDEKSIPIGNITSERWRILKAQWDNRNIYNNKRSIISPHFLDLLLTNTLKNVVFVFWYESDITTNKTKVKNAGNEKRFPLPDDDEQWDYWVENSLTGNKRTPAKLTKTFSKYKNCIAINVICTMENELYSEFYKPSNIFISQYFGKLLPFFDKKTNSTEVISYYRKIKKSNALGFSSTGKKNEEFITLLNSSLNINKKKWEEFAQSDSGKLGFCEPKTLRKLLKNAI